MRTPDDHPANDAAWTCPSCGATASSPFCPACGERRWNEHDLTFKHLLEQLLESLIHFDGRLFRTARVLVTAPGRLTTAYLTGCHRPYVAPFHIFLVANVIFFLVQLLSRLEILSVPLASELEHQIYSSFAQRLVTQHLAGTGMSIGQYAPIFEHAEGLYAKSLIMLMLPLFAMAAGLLFVDRRKVAVAHLVFAVHFYAFLLVFLTVLFPAFALVTVVLHQLGIPMNAGVLDWIATLLEALPCVVYLAKSTAVVYQAGLVRCWLSASLLTVATLYILYAYRLVLFVVTLWAT
jgi:hypothetical protein